jgi:hypothetical protein
VLQVYILGGRSSEHSSDVGGLHEVEVVHPSRHMSLHFYTAYNASVESGQPSMVSGSQESVSCKEQCLFSDPNLVASIIGV